MRINRRFVTAGATFFLAAATGHVMQSGTNVAARLVGGGGESVVLAAVPSQAEAQLLVSQDTEITPLSADLQGAADPMAPRLPAGPAAEPVALQVADLASRMQAVERGYVRTPSAADREYSAFGLACADARLDLSAEPGAMVGIRLAAPCHRNERVTLHHAGLSVTVATDDAGEFTGSLPGFAVEAEVTASFSMGEGVSAATVLADLATVRRAAVVWRGEDGFALGAYEDGADFGGTGYVTSERAEGRGRVVVLGDARVAGAMRAEVYSGPAELGDLAVEVTATVTEATCGRELAGTTLRLDGGTLTEAGISVNLPGCDALGDSVVLALPAIVAPVAVAAGGQP